MQWWVYIGFSVLMYSAGEYFSKIWVNNPSWQTIIFLVIVDVISVLLWLPALKQRNSIVLLGIFWLVSALVANIILGLVVFHETIKLVHIIGIGLALVSGILLSQ